MKCFICLQAYGVSVPSTCFKNRSCVAHGMPVESERGCEGSPRTVWWRERRLGSASHVGDALPRSVGGMSRVGEAPPRPPASCVRPGVVTVIAGKSCMGRGSCLGGKRRRKWGEGERGEETNGNHPFGASPRAPGMGYGGRIWVLE